MRTEGEYMHQMLRGAWRAAGAGVSAETLSCQDSPSLGLVCVEQDAGLHCSGRCEVFSNTYTPST